MTKRFNKLVKKYAIPATLGLATAPLSVKQAQKYIDSKGSNYEQTDTISPKFDKEVEKSIPKAILVKPQTRIEEPKIAKPQLPTQPKTLLHVPDDTQLGLKELMLYIAPTELKGDINKEESVETLLKRDPSVLSPYRDSKDLWTVGVGHLIGDGSDRALIEYRRERAKKGLPLAMSIPEAIELYKTQLQDRYNFAQRYFGPHWKNMPKNVKKVVIDAHFRGDLINKKNPSVPFKWVELIKQGRYGDAGKEYIDHNEYRKALKGEGRGIAIRMNRNKALLDLEAKKQRELKPNEDI